MLHKGLLLAFSAVIISCSPRKDVKFEQYMVHGERLYEIHCANCHQSSGEGLGRLIPPLKGSDYLAAHAGNLACLLKFGLADSIIVLGQMYNQPMPANVSLDPIDIAEILTYITNSWGNEGIMVTVPVVNQQLASCE